MAGGRRVNWTDLSNAPWLTHAISIASIVIATGVAFWVYRAGKPSPMLGYDVEAMGVFGLGRDHVTRQLVEHLSVSWKGQPVRSLGVAQVTFWNAGNTLIESHALATQDPLRITVPDKHVQVLDVRVIDTTTKASAPQVAVGSDGQVGVGFDFLNPGAGFVVRVVHTGRTSDVKAKGALRGVTVKNSDGPPMTNKERRIREEVVPGVLVLLLLGMAFWLSMTIGLYGLPIVILLALFIGVPIRLIESKGPVPPKALQRGRLRGGRVSPYRGE
jgi:hypothetical protein